MRALLALLLVILSVPGALAQAPGGAPPPRFQLEVATAVLSTALAFIAPRALDPVSVRQLAAWGLAAPGTLDDSLSTEVRDNNLVLLRAETELWRAPFPPDDSAAAWGAFAARLLEAAALHSPAIRAAGTSGLLAAFFDEVFNHLDPYSRYVPPATAEADRSRRDGEAGPGFDLRRQGTGFVVGTIGRDSPAADAGIRAGDQLLAIDGQPLSGKDADAVDDLLSGPEDSDLSLTVRTGRARPRTLDLKRALMIPETVFAERSGDLVVVRITAFSADTDQRLAQELARTMGGPAGRRVRGLVLDLRSNRGGRLQQAVSATDLLLATGTIATTAGRDPAAAHSWRASGDDLATGRPVVVLVDGRSASAAEVMAAALADGGRAVVVGSATLGKGLVQRILNLPDRGELFVSWSRILAPAGWPLQGLGVLPQVCTSKGGDALAAQLAALDRGTQPMEAALARHRTARAPLPAAEILALRNPCPAAESRDTDLATARFLLSHPTAYATALLGPP